MAPALSASVAPQPPAVAPPRPDARVRARARGADRRRRPPAAHARGAGQHGLDHARQRHERLDGGDRRIAVAPRRRREGRQRVPGQGPELGAGRPARVQHDGDAAAVADHRPRCGALGARAAARDRRHRDRRRDPDRATHARRAFRARAASEPPGAIVLLSDGASNVGSDPITAAHQAAAGAHPDLHGRARDGERHGHGEARQPDGDRARAARTRRSSPRSPASRTGRPSPRPTRRGSTRSTSDLGAELGHKKVKHEITASFAGGGLVLLLLGSVVSLAGSAA